MSKETGSPSHKHTKSSSKTDNLSTETTNPLLSALSPSSPPSTVAKDTAGLQLDGRLFGEVRPKSSSQELVGNLHKRGVSAVSAGVSAVSAFIGVDDVGNKKKERQEKNFKNKTMILSVGKTSKRDFDKVSSGSFDGINASSNMEEVNEINENEDAETSYTKIIPAARLLELLYKIEGKEVTLTLSAHIFLYFYESLSDNASLSCR
jgi:hypothetical protein